MSLQAKKNEPRPWPLEPLHQWMAASLGRMAHRVPCQGCWGLSSTEANRMCLPITGFAERLGVDRKHVDRWMRSGLTTWQADELAVRAGTHPGCVWPGWAEAGMTALDVLHIEGSENALPGWRQAYEWELAG